MKTEREREDERVKEIAGMRVIPTRYFRFNKPQLKNIIKLPVEITNIRIIKNVKRNKKLHKFQ